MKPRVVVSRCLGFKACRWNAEIVNSNAVNVLKDRVEFVTVCPEQDIGLSVPRKPINLVRFENAVRVIQIETGIDVTDELKKFSAGFLERLGMVDGFILKSRSPSCGHGTTKIHEGSTVSMGSGVFASCVEDRYPGCVVIDEEELGKMGPEAFLRLLATS